MDQRFIEKCKKNDRGIRASLQDRRFAILGQIDNEEQDFLVIGMDRGLIAGTKGTGFIITAKIDEKHNNVIFQGYNQFVDDMYSVGYVDIGESGYKLNDRKKALPSIKEKIDNMEDLSKARPLNVLKLDENESWFHSYVIRNNHSIWPEHRFTKEDLKISAEIFEGICAINDEYNLSTAPRSTFPFDPEE